MFKATAVMYAKQVVISRKRCKIETYFIADH